MDQSNAGTSKSGNNEGQVDKKGKKKKSRSRRRLSSSFYREVAILFGNKALRGMTLTDDELVFLRHMKECVEKKSPFFEARIRPPTPDDAVVREILAEVGVLPPPHSPIN